MSVPLKNDLTKIIKRPVSCAARDGAHLSGNLREIRIEVDIFAGNDIIPFAPMERSRISPRKGAIKLADRGASEP